MGGELLQWVVDTMEPWGGVEGAAADGPVRGQPLPLLRRVGRGSRDVGGSRGLAWAWVEAAAERDAREGSLEGWEGAERLVKQLREAALTVARSAHECKRRLEQSMGEAAQRQAALEQQAATSEQLGLRVQSLQEQARSMVAGELLEAMAREHEDIHERWVASQAAVNELRACVAERQLKASTAEGELRELRLKAQEAERSARAGGEPDRAASKGQRVQHAAPLPTAQGARAGGAAGGARDVARQGAVSTGRGRVHAIA